MFQAGKEHFARKKMKKKNKKNSDDPRSGMVTRQILRTSRYFKNVFVFVCTRQVGLYIMHCMNCIFLKFQDKCCMYHEFEGI